MGNKTTTRAAVAEAFGRPAAREWVAISGGDALGHLAIQYAQAMGHHPVDRLLPQSNLQRMKLLFEGEDGAETKAPQAGAFS
jgi:D-arabinose 1-dehydrogenase-like Zn-dependent alcohol dehydrogenase